MNDMVKIIYDTFSDEELESILKHASSIKNFGLRNDDIYHFYGIDMSINKNDFILSSYIKHGLFITQSQVNIFRVQRVDNSVIPTENFHTHDESIPHSIVTFLNDDFEGGLFQYKIGDEITSIKPVKNMTLFFDGSIPHRVTAVNGSRLSLVLFLSDFSKHKNTKTIL
jgi:hypothetical protein